MQIDQLTFDVLKTLTLPNIEKLQHLGIREEGRVFLFPDATSSEGIEQPAECFAILAAKTFHRYRGVFDQDKAWGSIRDVWCVLEMALELRRTVDYFWVLDPEKTLTGPFDDMWLVLESLSKTALTKRGIHVMPPQTTFAELLAHWDVTVHTNQSNRVANEN